MTILDRFLTWFNQKRLRDYPRLMLVATWLILGANIMFHDGWQGGLGQIIGGDFIMFYSTGLLYEDNPASIYDYDQQAKIQQQLVNPTVLPGLNPYMNPPYVAQVYGLLTKLPLEWSFIAWTALMIFFAILSIMVLIKIIPSEVKNNGLTRTQFIVLIMSFFPFIESLQAGQNSGVTLLLITCLVYFSLRERHYLAGVMAGLMLYKPQYILGFLILWVVWKNIKSLLGFAFVAIFWIGSFYVANGLSLFYTYQDLSQLFLTLPYIAGFPAYILVTLYGLLTTIFPQSIQPFLYGLSQATLVIGMLFLVVYAYQSRKEPVIDRTPAITLAILLPLLATPYALLHDLVILFPAFALWAHYNPSRKLLLVAICVYFGTFILTFLSALSHVALNTFIIAGLTASVSLWIYRDYRRLSGSS